MSAPADPYTPLYNSILFAHQRAGKIADAVSAESAAPVHTGQAAPSLVLDLFRRIKAVERTCQSPESCAVSVVVHDWFARLGMDLASDEDHASQGFVAVSSTVSVPGSPELPRNDFVIHVRGGQPTTGQHVTKALADLVAAFGHEATATVFDGNGDPVAQLGCSATTHNEGAHAPQHRTYKEKAMADTPQWNNLIRLQIGDPATLTASVPTLLGFYPQDSLVLVTTTGGTPALLGVTVRVDLPPPWHSELVAHSLVEHLRVNEATSAALVLVGSSHQDPDTPEGGWAEPSETGLPHKRLVMALAATLAEAGIDVLHAVWTPRIKTGQKWWCYRDPHCVGEVPDVRSTELAAAAALTGNVTLHERDEIIAMLEPAAPHVLRRVGTALAQRANGAPAINPLPTVQSFVDAMANTHELTRPEGAERVADLLTALESEAVRTACMRMALEERAGDAERLWIALTKAAPPRWRAEPACLLALTAYARGNGTLARVAVDAALDVAPNHGLAALLGQALSLGLPSRAVRAIIADLTEA